MPLTRSDWLLVVGLFIFFALLGTVGWFFAKAYAFVLLIAAAVALTVAIHLASHRTIKGRLLQVASQYEQIQEFLSLYTLLDTKYPLPKMGIWSIAPDFATLLVTLVRKHEPRCIVECGSGTSTVITAHCLEEIGKGQIVSLDHKARFAERTRQLLRQRGQQAIAEVRDAPLKPVQINGTTWDWYDTQALEGLEEIDLLVVDGPPTEVMPQARYPALPLLIDRLSADAVVLVDDADRSEEKHMVERWLEQFKDFEAEFVDNSRGAYVLRRKKATA